MKAQNVLAFCLVGTLAIGLIGCGSGDGTTTTTPAGAASQNIVQLAQGSKTLSTLVTALTAGKLVETLEGKGPFTVFAPTNDAFAALNQTVLANLLNDTEALDKVLEYHVIAGSLDAKELTKMETAKTLEGASVTISSTSSGVMVNNATVQTADVEASNGIVHIIDSVLMPPTKGMSNIVELAVGTPDLSTLVTALTAGKLVKTLEGAGPFTVFAPTNEAFAKIDQAALQELLANVTALDKVLTYHVCAGTLKAADLIKAGKAKTLEGDDVTVSQTSSGVKVNSATVETADVEASNGIVHIIDTVLMPPAQSKNIVELAVGTPDLSTLVTALTAGKLVKTLEGAGPFTVFAPTNEAFAKIDQAALEKLLADVTALDKVLTYHVCAGTLKAADLIKAGKAETLEGDEVTVSHSSSGVKVNDAKVETADVEASNGVVHIIDTVLMPPAQPSLLTV